MNAQNKTVAVQLDFEKYGELIEELLDALEAEAHKDDETITLAELKAELKQEGNTASSIVSKRK